MGLFRVDVFSNSRPSDMGHSLTICEFQTEAEAIACAKKIIEASLRKLRQPNMTPVRLFAEWAVRGDGVRIRARTPVPFRHIDYARDRAYRCR